MSKFQIEWLEQKTTSTGKVKANVTLKDEQGVMKEDVTIWGDWAGFAELRPGSTVEGELVPAKDPKYGPTLYPPRKVASGGSFGPNRPMPAAISKAMDRKEGSIEKFTDRKEESIKMAGAIRDSVLIVTAMLSHARYAPRFETEVDIENALKKWQKYVYELHDQPFI